MNAIKQQMSAQNKTVKNPKDIAMIIDNIDPNTVIYALIAHAHAIVCENSFDSKYSPVGKGIPSIKPNKNTNKKVMKPFKIISECIVFIIIKSSIKI